MTRVLKSNQVYNSKNLSVSKVKSVYQPIHIAMLSPKAETHNTPHKSSNNESVLVDYFYEKVHNLKATYQRFSDQNIAKHYYKSHKQEILLGGKNLVRAINLLMKEAKEIDDSYGTHFHFLIEAILRGYESQLIHVGLYFNSGTVHFDRRKFTEIFYTDITSLNFLYQENGLVDQLIKVNFKILSIGKNNDFEGQIIDYHA